MRWKDIDFKEGTLRVSQQLVRVKAGLIFQEPKTKLSRRTINIPDVALKELKALKTKQGQERWKLQEAYQNNDLVFCSEEGKPIDPRNFVRNFESILKKAGIDKLRFHDLRHTYATLSLQEGVSARAIQEILGHHSPAFTMSQYAHVTSKMKQEASDKIGGLLSACIKK